MHDVADRVAEEQRRAAHGEVGVEVRDAHGLRVALEEGDVVGLEDGGHELDEHALVATRVDRGLHGRARARCVLCVQMKRRARVCAGRSAADNGRGGERVRAAVQSVCGARGHERHDDAGNTCEREDCEERDGERDECAAHLGAHDKRAKYCVVWR